MHTTSSMTSTGEINADYYLKSYAIEGDDLNRIREFGKHMQGQVESYVEDFYVWLRVQPEFDEFFHRDDALVRRVAAMMAVYWREFFSGTVDDVYITKRRTVGQVHARIGLPLPIYFAAMNFWLTNLIQLRVPAGISADDLAVHTRSIMKLVHMDTAIVVEVYNDETNRKLSQQTKTIMEMSTPVSSIWEDILLLPLVGLMDSSRAHEVMNSVLLKISQSRARVFIMDISGVAVVDTAVANHLIKITQATRLMGCESIISGLSPAVAQTIVELGVEVGSIRTTATLRDALELAFRSAGVTLSRAEPKV